MDYSTLYYPAIPGCPRKEEDHSVTVLQHALSLLGFSLAQDGAFGPKTKAALEKFQGIHKLKMDGVAGPLTWAALQQALRFR